MMKKVYKHKKGDVVDCSDMEMPREWIGRFFSGEALAGEQYEQDTTFVCTKSFELTITLKQ